MRFKKGSKVEVFSNREVPSGSWYSAEIINGNGHYYTVRYDEEIGGLAGIVSERVPRKAIRPCPPLVQPLEGWVSGDVVEVFNQFSWKVATVLRALQTGWFLVRLLGSSQEVEVREVDVRPGLFWQRDRWNVIEKGSINCEERPDVPSLPNHNQDSQLMGTTASIHLKASRIPCSNMNSIPKKRKLENSNHQSEAHAVRNKKTILNEKDRRRNQFISIVQPPLSKKVEMVASSRAVLVEKCVPPVSRRLTGCSKKKSVRDRMEGAAARSPAVDLDSAGAYSITSSVASRSMSRKNTHEIPQNYRLHPFEDNDDYSSDAESFCQNRLEEGNFLLPTDQKLTTEIHRIELQAYRSTIEALYASGPLSWEQETLLTDLRDSLHISNDEHLMELKSLVSSNTCIPNS